MLLADGAGFWDWAIKFMDPQTLTQVGIILGLVLKHLRDEYNKKDVKKEVTDGNEMTKENKKAIEDVLPAVVVKVDSANKKSEETQEKAEKVVENMAGKVAVFVTKELKDKAEIDAKEVKEAAKVVAQAAEDSRSQIQDTVKELSNAIKGTDGTCLTGQVKNNTDRIKEHGESMASFEKRLSAVETAMSKGFENILHEMRLNNSGRSPL